MMNDTPIPTPRTDKAAYSMGRSGEQRDIERWCDLLNESRKLETELTAAQEKIEWMNIRHGAAAMHHDNNMGEVMDQRDRLAEALRECREDSVELLGERDWWQLENRGDYQKRYQDTRDNVTRADAALESLNTFH